jgi:hypothetical protein
MFESYRTWPHSSWGPGHLVPVSYVKARIGRPVSWLLAMPLFAARLGLAAASRCLAPGCMPHTDVMRTASGTVGPRGRQRARNLNRRTGATCVSAKRSRFQIHVTDKSASVTVRVRAAVARELVDDDARSTVAGKSQLHGCVLLFGVAPLFEKTCTRRRPAVHRCPRAPFPTPSSTRFSSSQVCLPSLLRWRRTGTRRALAVGSAHLGQGVDGWGRSADRAWARPTRRCFFSERSRLLCRHRAPPFLGASTPDRSDAPHLIDGRQSSSQSKTCIVHRVHPSLRHRHRRAFLPRRSVSRRSIVSGDRAGVGRSAHGKRRARESCRIDHARLCGVHVSLQLSGWSLR